jgi:hypothetical protein
MSFCYSNEVKRYEVSGAHTQSMCEMNENHMYDMVR